MGDKEFLSVIITNNVNDLQVEKRFPSDVTVLNLKGKLELVTGIMMNSMKLELRNEEDSLIKPLSDDSLTLANCDVKNGMKIHVIDTCPSNEEADEVDVAFVLGSEEYASREDSARNFLIKNKLGKYDEEKLLQKKEVEKKEEELSKSISVSSRCEITTLGQPSRRGEVMYVGKVHFKEGIWVGVKFDEPLGKNDGSIDNKRYFECKKNYGGFTRPTNVTIGDFPEIEIDDIDEI